MSKDSQIQESDLTDENVMATVKKYAQDHRAGFVIAVGLYSVALFFLTALVAR